MKAKATRSRAVHPTLTVLLILSLALAVQLGCREETFSAAGEGRDLADAREAEDKPKAGLEGIYFQSGDFTRPGHVDILTDIDHDWGRDRGNDWSARWEGFIEGPHSGDVTFSAEANDGIKLEIAGGTVIDGLRPNGPRRGTARMEKGQKTPLKLEFTSSRGKAKLQLFWQWQGRPKAVVPPEALSHVTRFTEWQPTEMADQPVRYVGTQSFNKAFTDGGLRPAAGTHNHQVIRANRTHPVPPGDTGWTYNHGPNIAYWNDKLYVHYLSNPVGEHEPPGRTLITTSTDGIEWSRPIVVFEPLNDVPNAGDLVMHQRMGFYTAPDRRLLVLGFYGIPTGRHNSPNAGNGLGRVVREIHRDGSLGPVYFIRYNRHSGFNETNCPYPHYSSSKDDGFKAACDSLLADKLVTQQWWEEDRSTDGFFALAGVENAEFQLGPAFSGKALSFFHRADGTAVGMWKGAWAAVSRDEGRSWTEPVQCTSICSLRSGYGSKLWGQRTDDGRYAIVYNPDPNGKLRYPLAVITSDDGVEFDDMACVHGEVSPQRFEGVAKTVTGPQYVRGIAEGNGNPPGSDLWVTYSMNKEDIWVSRIPVPVRLKADRHVNENFDQLPAGGFVPGWNVYSPKWAPVSVVERPGGPGMCLRLEDKDCYDHAGAARILPESTAVSVELEAMAAQCGTGRLEIEMLDGCGRRPVRLVFAENGRIEAADGGKMRDVAGYAANMWVKLSVTAGAAAGRYSLIIDGKTVLDDAAFAEPAPSIERLSLRTGRFRGPERWTRDDRPGADEPDETAVFHVDNVRTSGLQTRGAGCSDK